MRVAGIDLSTHAVDIVTVPLEGTEAPVWMRHPLTGADSFSRARKVRHAMLSRTDAFWDDILAIGIEDPAGHHGTNHIYRIQGAVLQCLPSLVLVQQWRPAAWKKAVGLKGNASKGDIMAAVPTFAWNVDWPSDACDAYFVALATRAVIQVGEQAA